ncbi:MAG: hypothetical protein LBM70_03040 [Victivallales bacterium]|jgi:hypothetical protein|nr:hypothetical protein [Victivallales bacterium]
MVSRSKKKKPGFTRKLLLVSAGILLLLSLIAFGVAALLFGKASQFQVEPLNAADSLLITKLMSRFANELQQNKASQSELIFNPKEVNSLIRIANNGVDPSKLFFGRIARIKTQPHRIRYENGKFEIIAPVQTKLTWLWGGVIMVEMSVHPRKVGDDLSAGITRVKWGAIKSPDFMLSKINDKAVARLRAHKDFSKFNRCVKSIQIDSDENLHIVYDPPEIRNTLLQRK